MFLLYFFVDIFSELTNLPPQRKVDHRIPLLLITASVNVRPYCYAHWQKDDIEHQAAEMLHMGIIRHSSSSFSSSALLVGKSEGTWKSDGTWRFCTDYRRLNLVTILDRFPIPIADKHFDELYGAVIFFLTRLMFRLSPNSNGE